MNPLRVVLGEKYTDPSCTYYYDGWYLDKNNEPQIYTVSSASNAKVIKMYGFEILWGDHPPPDQLKARLMRDYQPVPVKVVVLQ